MDKNQWSAAIQRTFGAATRSLPYGCWRVEKLPNALIYDGEVWGQAKEGWKVVDMRGNVIVVVATEEMARLLALVPDLCDADLRGTGTGMIRSMEDERKEFIKLAGVPDPQEAYEIGYTSAFNEGEANGYALAKSEFEDADTDSVEEAAPHGCLAVGLRRRGEV